jgi:exonuclease SbcC
VKILAISLKNLASFAGEVTVDFRTAPLSHAGVFAIIGPTGAGKSTLLDALCLALYGDTPRANASNQAKILVEGDEGWTAQDPRHLVRHGADEGSAKVTFEAEGGVYEAAWRCRRAKKGARTLQPGELELRRDGEVIALKVKQVTATITALTGLDFDSFCRSVLLPQGQFERFLTCKSDERSELLEALTDPTGLYRGISILAHVRGGEWKNRILEAEAQVNAIRVLTDEERAALATRLAEYAAEAAQTGEAIDRVARARDVHKNIVDAATTLDTRRRASADCDAARLAAEPDRRTLDEALAAAPLRATGKTRDEAEARMRESERALTALDTELTEAAEAAQKADKARAVAAESHAAADATLNVLRPQLEQARACDRALAKNEVDRVENRKDLAELDDKERELAARCTAQAAHDATVQADVVAVEAWFSAHPEASALQAHRAVWSTALHDLANAEDGLAKARTARETLRREESARADDEARARDARAEASQRVDDARMAANAARERAEALRAADPQGQRDAVTRRGQSLELLGTKLAQRREDRALHAKRVAEASRADDEAAARDVERTALAGEVERLEVALAEADRAHVLAQVRADLGKHRAALVDGEPCVVCGSTVHPWADPSAVPTDDDTTRRALADSLRTAHASLRACTAALDGATQRARLAREEADRIDGRLGQSRAGLESECAALGLPTNLDDDTHEAAWSTLRTALDGERGRLDAAVRDADESTRAERAATQTLSRLSEELNAAIQAANDALRALDEVRARASMEVRSIDEGEARVHECDARAGEALSAIPNAVAAYRADVRGQRAAWLALADACDTRQRQRAQLAEDAHRLASERAALDTDRQVLDTERKPVEARRAALDAEHAELRAARAGLLEGRAADDVEQEAAQRLAACASQLDIARKASADAEQRLTNLRGQRHVAASGFARHCDEADTARRDHAERLASLGLDEAEALRRLALSDDALRALAERLHALDTDAKAARALVNEAEGAWRRAEAERPAQTAEELDTELAELATKRDDIQRAVGADQHAIASDEAQRALREARQRDLEAVEREGGVWGKLASLLGHGNGDTFALYAQSLAFDSLLASANEQLARLHPRYALRRLEDAAPEVTSKRAKTHTLLDMVIEDREMADAVRPVSTLSGGERFLVSLALALGLSSLASQRRKLASMFIDEGFGTLDPETLSTALGVLDALQARGTRVGVISHVSELKERLQARVVVERLGDGTSTLRVEG